MILEKLLFHFTKKVDVDAAAVRVAAFVIGFVKEARDFGNQSFRCHAMTFREEDHSASCCRRSGIKTGKIVVRPVVNESIVSGQQFEYGVVGHFVSATAGDDHLIAISSVCLIVHKALYALAKITVVVRKRNDDRDVDLLL